MWHLKGLLLLSIALFANGSPDTKSRKITFNRREGEEDSTSIIQSLLTIHESSPLVKMITGAVSNQFIETVNAANGDSKTEKKPESIGETTMENVLHALNNTRVEQYLIPLLNETNPNVLQKTFNQIGDELGDGSKFIEGMPSFAELDATSLTTIGGLGAMAMIAAVGAAFAVPVPIILRRQGPAKNNNRGSWFSSFTNLFSWFNDDEEEPNPNYIDYSYHNYHDAPEYEFPEETYYEENNHDTPFTQYNTQNNHNQRVQSNGDQYNRHQNDYQYLHRNPHQEYEDENNNFYDQNTQQYDQQHQNHQVHYQDTHEKIKQLQQEQNEKFQQLYQQQQERKRFTRPKKAEAPTIGQRPTAFGLDEEGHSFQVGNSYSVGNSKPSSQRRSGPNRRTGYNGYEYVSLHRVNKIADESLNSLVAHYEELQNRRNDESRLIDQPSSFQNYPTDNNQNKIQADYQKGPEYSFTEEDAIAGPVTMSPMQQEQEHYKKLYQSRYAELKRRLKSPNGPTSISESVPTDVTSTTGDN